MRAWGRVPGVMTLAPSLSFLLSAPAWVNTALATPLGPKGTGLCRQRPLKGPENGSVHQPGCWRLLHPPAGFSRVRRLSPGPLGPGGAGHRSSQLEPTRVRLQPAPCPLPSAVWAEG